MMNKWMSSVSSRRSLVIWAGLCVIAGITFLAYTLCSVANGHGELVMPLDDVYIHFQYARQIAAGQPYVYNPGLPPTSGATSFLYPYVLAIGYELGLQGLRLGLWAMAVGAIAMVCAMWLVYKLVRLFGRGEWLAVLVAVAFGVNGSVAWHFMSGMETGLMMLFTLGTLYAVIEAVGEDNKTGRTAIFQVVMWATALALIRPEGGLLAVIAVTVVGCKLIPPSNPLTLHREGGIVVRSRRWGRLGLVIPALAVGVQPFANLLLTGSAVASGNAAKSILGMVPFYGDDVIRRILSNFGQIWVEFGTGMSPREGLYIMPLLLLVALVGIGGLLANIRLRAVGVMVVLWLISVTLMLATLDTVFWHFKRYQMPFMALLFPLAGWGIGVVARCTLHVTRENAIEPPSRQEYLPQRHRENREEIQIEPQRRGGRKDHKERISNFYGRGIAYVMVVGMLVVAAITSGQFWQYYGLNVRYVYAQPLQMARWLAANTPPNAVIAVHDVGMMRYMGGRTTLDMVGLTTKGAADYWRNGPGAVAEFLLKEQPDIIASYGHGHGFGLGMVADTAIYGQPLASFPVELDNHANVALAADFQGIYKPDWTFNQKVGVALQPNLFRDSFDQSLSMGHVNVGDIASEQKAYYSWRNVERLLGFPTEVHEFDYVSCAIENCHLIDGGRLINGEESFDLLTGFDSGDYYPMALVTRLHPASAGTFDVYAGGELVGTRWIPAIPGQWLEIATCIPANVMGKYGRDGRIHIRIVPHIPGGYYMPYYHWLYGCPSEGAKPDNPQSTFQDGAIQLGSAKLDYQPGKARLGVNFEWYTNGSAKGDYKVFVHLYSDTSKPPVAQLDMRPGNGALPPGNWLPGVLRDTITVDLAGVSSGRYQVAIGMYDPVTFERLQPIGGDEQRRLFIGEVKITE